MPWQVTTWGGQLPPSAPSVPAASPVVVTSAPASPEGAPPCLNEPHEPTSTKTKSARRTAGSFTDASKGTRVWSLCHACVNER